MSDTSESSDQDSIISSDEEYLDLFENRIKPKNENYLLETVNRYNDSEFFEHFRISRRVLTQIAREYERSNIFKHQAGGNGKINALHQVTIFLWFAGHQTASFRDVADRFDITISSLFRIIRRQIYFLSYLSPQVIKWPTELEKIEIERYFREKDFPGVIGAIDGSHIKIDRPNNDPDSYLNRKHFFSIQVQIVCDHQKKIRDIFVGYPGSVHDSRVFRTSPLSITLDQKCGEYYILEDSGYPCLHYLLTPYKDRGHLTQRQRNFNYKLSSNRYIIEHCFGIMKQKLRQLYHVKLRKIPDIVHFIRACSVLHNFAIDDEFNYEAAVELDLNAANALPQLPDDDEDNDDNNGIAFRNYVANNIL